MSNDQTISEYLEMGFIKFNLEGNHINNIIEMLGRHLNYRYGVKDFNKSHLKIRDKLNEVRLECINMLNEDWVREELYESSQKFLDLIVGNEIVIQARPNLSVHMPGDESSILPIHTDVWCGNSPFEVVLWLPFVDCEKTKSFFVLPKNYSEEAIKMIKEGKMNSTSNLYERYEDKFEWINIKKGEGLIFSHHIVHGNVLNQEDTTRWSINCRFKSLFSPYADKKLGDYFLPLRVSPQTIIGKSIYERNLF